MKGSVPTIAILDLWLVDVWQGQCSVAIGGGQALAEGGADRQRSACVRDGAVALRSDKAVSVELQLLTSGLFGGSSLLHLGQAVSIKLLLEHKLCDVAAPHPLARSAANLCR